MNEMRTSLCSGCGGPDPERVAGDVRACPRCRAEIAARASRWAWAAVVVVAPFLGILLARWGLMEHRFFILWLILAAGVLFLLFRVARRVSFELIHSRRFPPAKA